MLFLLYSYAYSLNSAILQNLVEYKEISVRPPNFSGASIYVQGRHAILIIDTGNALAGMTNGSILFNIPQGFRPKIDIPFATLSSNFSSTTDDSATFPIAIRTNGNVEVFTVSKPLPARAFYGCISYFI